MWFMAISERLGVLAVSDPGDERYHKIQIYDFDGRHLLEVAGGHKTLRLPSLVRWPRGVAFDGKSQFLFVIDEGMRILKFRLEDRRFDSLICEIPFEKGGHSDAKPLLYHEHQLYTVGFKSEKEDCPSAGVRKTKPRWIAKSYLFVIQC